MPTNDENQSIQWPHIIINLKAIICSTIGTTVPMVPFTSDKTGATEFTITGITGYYSEDSNLAKWFLLLYTKQSRLPITH